MWENQENFFKGNDQIKDNADKNTEKINDCITFCNNSKKKLEEISYNMAENSKKLIDKYNILSKSIKGNNKRMDHIENNLTALDDKKFIYQNNNKEIEDIKNKIKESEET